jgi:hypothetical protein
MKRAIQVETVLPTSGSDLVFSPALASNGRSFFPGGTVHLVIFRNRGGLSLEVGEDEAIIDVVEAAGHVLPIACRYASPVPPR